METSDLSYPYLTCELGGGMMPAYHRRINMSGKEIKPLAICKLGSGSNLPGYYMYHGGTNPYCKEHTMAETQASPVTNYNDMPQTSYDFQKSSARFFISQQIYNLVQLLKIFVNDMPFRIEIEVSILREADVNLPLVRARRQQPFVQIIAHNLIGEKIIRALPQNIGRFIGGVKKNFFIKNQIELRGHFGEAF